MHKLTSVFVSFLFFNDSFKTLFSSSNVSNCFLNLFSFINSITGNGSRHLLFWFLNDY